jgi:hypothetical protein
MCYVSGKGIAKWEGLFPLLSGKWEARLLSVPLGLGFHHAGMSIAERCLNAQIWAF